MGWFIEALQSVREFLEAGGYVLLSIGVLTWIMWFLIIERVLFFNIGIKQEVQQVYDNWNMRKDHNSWYAQQIRQRLVSHICLKTNFALPTIRTLIMLCPLLGLLGTVSGMIEVFEALTQGESENIRSIASGFSKAIISTLAGLVSALSGLIAFNFLNKKALKINQHLTHILADK
ncbi:hypothetical protein A9Q81_02595 [Gammaproteobacteria bacterium 42_54_T18]|nr:hypothetical protein A9Q81_02595 [Gammaproteobacteria bacterium 42_54_T18]